MTRLGQGGPTVVVGAGPAGALMALYLARAGHHVDLFESRPDLRHVDVDAGRSINLALATRGLVALAEVGLADRIDAITVPMAGRMVHPEPAGGGPRSGAPTTTTELTLPATDFQPYGTSDEEIIRSINRSDLNAILLDGAEATGRVRLHVEHRLRAVDFDRRRLTFTTPDGAGRTRKVESDFGTVFGCDGANSVVRSHLLEVNGGRCEIDPLDHGYKELTIPPGEDRQFALDPRALHIWPRGDLMLIALANPTHDFTATLFMPETGKESFATIGPDQIEAFFGHHFPDVVPLLPDLTEQFRQNPVGDLATVRTTGWSLDHRAVLVGDAAHAIVPFHGQGMNLAMESCRLLHRALAAQPDDLAAAFLAFEADRKPDADAIAAMALDNYLEMRSDVIDPTYQIRRDLALELSRRLPERFAHRYGMVMFTTMPYAEVQARAERQGALLDQLTAGVGRVEDVDLDHAAATVAALGPLPEWR